MSAMRAAAFFVRFIKYIEQRRLIVDDALQFHLDAAHAFEIIIFEGHTPRLLSRSADVDAATDGPRRRRASHVENGRAVWLCRRRRGLDG